MKKKIVLLIKAFFAGIGIGEKIDNQVWIFSSTDNEQYNYNSKYLFEYVKEHVEGITLYYVINDDKKRESLQKKYGEQYFIETHSIKGIRKVLKSGVWFTSAGLPVYGIGIGKRHNIINLWHGVPLKKIGLMDSNLKGIGRKYFKYIFTDNYKYIVTTSKNLVTIMQESFAVAGRQIKVWGQPRNDVIFHKQDAHEIMAALYKNLPTYEKLILYAPTFRDNGETWLFPFEDFNITELESFLEEKKIVLCIRSHINDNLEILHTHTGRIRFMNSDIVDDVTEVLNIFDLLITDYSSIYIDYLMTEKPMLFLPYDKEEYLATRGMNFEYDEVTPGPKPETMKTFFEDVKELLDEEDSYKEQRRKLNRFFNEIQEPCSRTICENVIEELGLNAQIKG